jgi:hypothetical protein
MMKLVLASKPTEGIEENSSNHEIKIWAKISPKIIKIKNIAAQGRR